MTAAAGYACRADSTFRRGFVRTARWKIIHGLGFCLFFAQLAGAFEVAAMQQPKFYLCTHTKQRIEKGKPCPCGCDKRMKALARVKLLAADHPCAGESDEPILPAFSRWSFTFEKPWHVASIKTVPAPVVRAGMPQSFVPELDTPPPRSR